MFREMKNEGKLTFKLITDSPLSIRSGSINDIDPTLPDMQCIRTQRKGEQTVFIPGSSIKGVMRSRCERIINFLGGNVCNVVDIKNNCGSKMRKQADDMNGKERYEQICIGCRMFGSTVLGSRIKFKDAYPIDIDPKIGFRNGVGINRITGAAQKGALYDFEVVEEGKFLVSISLNNFELYQLKLLLFVLKDIDDGYAAFGGSSTRGNGKMKVEEVNFEYRDYRKDVASNICGYHNDDKSKEIALKKELYYKYSAINGLEELFDLLEDIDVAKSLI